MEKKKLQIFFKVYGMKSTVAGAARSEECDYHGLFNKAARMHMRTGDAKLSRNICFC
jgi:hypothetical protein